MRYSGKTDIGLKRKNNQDSFTVLSRESFLSAVVCDGMGGAKGGNVASSLAVRAYTQSIRTAMAKITPDALTSTEASRIIKGAVDKANKAVYEAANYDIELEGMGTTLVSVLICGGRAFIANVGDSRLYAYNDEVIKQITNDHSFVQYLLDKGSITQDEAMNHPNRNIILRALGVNESVEPEVFELTNEEYTLMLLCSDGLTTHLSDEEITEIIKGTEGKRISLKKRAEALIEEANNRGGTDNITAVILER